ncbi:MAG: hypothetical protein HC893_03510 [Chloroflexaceae bacterium]|nr:hypothetical protein [Chloroflexaceae bacterium]
MGDTDEHLQLSDHDQLVILFERQKNTRHSIESFGTRIGVLERDFQLHIQQRMAMEERLRQFEERIKRIDIDLDIIQKKVTQELDDVTHKLERWETRIQTLLWLGAPLVTVLAGLLGAALQYWLLP